jgi:hypothetical protein
MSAIETAFRASAGVEGSAPPSLSRAAWKPLCMFVPWSPSPISESSLVR